MREWKEKQRTMRHYDLQAEIYDIQYVGEQNAKIENILKSMKLMPKEQVLDLGCGTGFLFPHLSEKVGLVVGLDVSHVALQEAKKRSKRFSNILLVRADADNTPFVDHVFDKVFAITVLQNMPDPTKTIKEMKRAGKPQATFALTGLKKKFTQADYVGLLESNRLKIVELSTSQQLKGYTAVCTN